MCVFMVGVGISMSSGAGRVMRPAAARHVQWLWVPGGCVRVRQQASNGAQPGGPGGVRSAASLPAGPAPGVSCAALVLCATRHPPLVGPGPTCGSGDQEGDCRTALWGFRLPAQCSPVSPSRPTPPVGRSGPPPRSSRAADCRPRAATRGLAWPVRYREGVAPADGRRGGGTTLLLGKGCGVWGEGERDPVNGICALGVEPPAAWPALN
jgi:hypothetical protein